MSWRSRPGRPETPEEVFDRGLQQERTALAWDRTALSLVAAAVLYVRLVGPPLLRASQVPGLLALALGAHMLVVGSRRYADLHTLLRHRGSVAHHRNLRLVGLGTVAFGLACGLAILRS